MVPDNLQMPVDDSGESFRADSLEGILVLVFASIIGVALLYGVYVCVRNHGINSHYAQSV